MKWLMVIIGIGLVFMLPGPTSTLAAAGWNFLGELAIAVVSLQAALWENTPEVLRPLWGLLFCGIGFLMAVGVLVFQFTNRLWSHN